MQIKDLEEQIEELVSKIEKLNFIIGENKGRELSSKKRNGITIEMQVKARQSKDKIENDLGKKIKLLVDLHV